MPHRIIIFNTNGYRHRGIIDNAARIGRYRKDIHYIGQGRGEQRGGLMLADKTASQHDLAGQPPDIPDSAATERLQAIPVIPVRRSRAARADRLSYSRTEHLAGLNGIIDSQTHVQTDIRFHVGTDLSERILRASDQMHTQRPAKRRDTRDPIKIIRQHGTNGMEFVGDDDQSRGRIIQLIECGTTGLCDKLFTTTQFSLQRNQCTRGMRQIQVADIAHAMRQGGKMVEGRAAFEIQKHEVQT